MSMKFWFGKKGAEQSEQSNVPGDVLAIPDHGADSVVEPSSVFSVPQRNGVAIEPTQSPLAQSVSPVGGMPVVNVPADIGGGAAAAKVPEGVKSATESPVEKTIASVRLTEKPAPVLAKPVLRPLGVPVRLASEPVASVASVQKTTVPVSAVPPKTPPVSLTASTAARPAFGFRPKAGVASAASAVSAPAVVASAVPAAAVSAAKKDEEVRREEDLALVRPKVDQRALYYELMNGLYDAVLILDDQGHVVDSNTRSSDVLGYTREEAWDLPIDKVIPGMTSQMFAHLGRNLAENHHILIDARCFRKDGTAFASEVGVSTLSLTRGSNVVFAIRNVERRKSAMEELRKGQAAFQASLAPAFVCDTEGAFQIVNQALLDSFGIPNEAQAKTVRFVDLLPDAACFFLRASSGEKLRETLSISSPDGTLVKIDLSLSPIQGAQNSVAAVAGSILQM